MYLRFINWIWWSFPNPDFDIEYNVFSKINFGQFYHQKIAASKLSVNYSYLSIYGTLHLGYLNVRTSLHLKYSSDDSFNHLLRMSIFSSFSSILPFWFVQINNDVRGLSQHATAQCT